MHSPGFYVGWQLNCADYRLREASKALWLLYGNFEQQKVLYLLFVMCVASYCILSQRCNVFVYCYVYVEFLF